MSTLTALHPDTPDPAAEWWTTHDVTAWCGTSRQHLNKLIARGAFPPPDKPGHKGNQAHPNRWRPATVIEHHHGTLLAACRWPLQPLLDRSSLPLTTLAQAAGTTHGTFVRALEQGCTDTQADTWAVRLGYHPAEIWPYWATPTPHTADPDHLEAA